MSDKTRSKKAPDLEIFQQYDKEVRIERRLINKVCQDKELTELILNLYKYKQFYMNNKNEQYLSRENARFAKAPLYPKHSPIVTPQKDSMQRIISLEKERENYKSKVDQLEKKVILMEKLQKQMIEKCTNLEKEKQALEAQLKKELQSDSVLQPISEPTVEDEESKKKSKKSKKKKKKNKKKEVSQERDEPPIDESDIVLNLSKAVTLTSSDLVVLDSLAPKIKEKKGQCSEIPPLAPNEISSTELKEIPKNVPRGLLPPIQNRPLRIDTCSDQIFDQKSDDSKTHPKIDPEATKIIERQLEKRYESFISVYRCQESHLQI